MRAAHFAHRSFAHRNFAHNFHNRNFRGFRGGYGYGYGWYGPVFWPFAYDDLFTDILWGFGLGGPFWDYGYGDVYGGLFSPYGYNDLAGYLPGGQGATSSRVSRRTESRQANLSNQVSQMCGDDSREVAGWPIDRIEQGVSPTPNSVQLSMNSPTPRSGPHRRSKKPARPLSPLRPPDGWTRCKSGSRGWRARSTSSGRRWNASTVH
jgi:hypothetical protein